MTSPSMPIAVTVVESDGISRTLTTWPTGVPGLTVVQVPEESAACAGKWSVMHARSGMRLVYCLPDPEAALGLALALRDVADWQQPGQAVRAFMRRRPYVAAVLPYLPWRCKHGGTPGVITHDNGVIA